LTREKLLELKNFFSQMEVFHGKSSGLDPLNSYWYSYFNNSKDNIEATGT
jgi:mevalonate kinase